MIHIIGIGTGDVKTLADDARQAIKKASLIIGSQRQLSCIEALLTSQQQQQKYPSPLKDICHQLRFYKTKHPQHEMVLLASGDPLFYGISNLLLRCFPVEQLTFYSNISSIQTAFSCIKKPWQQAKIISLHGRAVSTLIPYLAKHTLIAVLTDQHSHPHAIAKILCDNGSADTILSICEALGTKEEKVSFFKAYQLIDNTESFHPLHITILEIKQCALPSFPGFEDHLFITDQAEAGKGMISKREVRLAALSLLQPKANDIAWDIGAGCGTIAVEWAYWNQQGTIYAIEHHPKRLDCLQQNKQKFGVNNLQIIADLAPAGLEHLPQPSAIFIGGTAGKLAHIMDYCWQKLANNGCLVINCVTENCKSELHAWLILQNIPQQALDWTEIAISKGGQLATQLLMRPRLPVRLLKISKKVNPSQT